MLKTPQEGETVTIDNYCATTAVSLWLHTLGIFMSHTSLPLCFRSQPKVKTHWSQLIMHVLDSMVKAMCSVSF